MEAGTIGLGGASKAPAFDDDQQLVIEQPVTAHILVDAAAGTGKTHTLIGRLTKLVQQDGLSCGDELLVLSFSRAAVAELRRRAALLGNDARFVGASTFDSFATTLLAHFDPAGAWQTADYDQRIRLACAQLRDAKDTSFLSLVRHVLVDEMQDLVGARAELVKILLTRLHCGFTLFGDPAQAIYDYQGDEVASDGVTNLALYEWLTETFAGSLAREGLTTDHRTRSDQTRLVARIGARLRERSPDHASIRSDIRTTALGLPVATPGTARRLLANSPSRSAVLTRTNGEALWVSRELGEAGIDHRLQRRGEDKAVAEWLSAVLDGLDGSRVTREKLQERLDQSEDLGGLTPDACLRLMRLLDPRRGSEFDVRRIADRVRCGDVPEDLNSVAPQNVVVSTIHRAKGLEFDRVLIVGELPTDHGDDQGFENRVAYVALSRAQAELWHLQASRPSGLRIDRASRRWVRRPFGRDAWKTNDVEIIGNDVHALHPAGAWLVEANVVDTQTYIRNDVRPGDPVRLELIHVSASGEGAFYAVIHDGRPVGVTSEAFASTLTQVLGRGTRHWPVLIGGIRVELVDTVAGHETVGRDAGLGSHGMWARVRVAGLGALHFAEGT